MGRPARGTPFGVDKGAFLIGELHDSVNGSDTGLPAPTNWASGQVVTRRSRVIAAVAQELQPIGLGTGNEPRIRRRA